MRKLKAIEIAEGALLADVAIVFQLLVVYFPFIGDFFRFLIFIVFAVLVLRRGLYVGVMGLFVAFFMTAVILGPQHLIIVALEGVGGLFLGITMKHRLRHTTLLFLGVTLGALTLYCLILGLLLLTGISFAEFIRSLQHLYIRVISISDLIAAKAGLELGWKHNVYPTLSSLVTWGLSYWWLSFYLVLWTACWPMVIVIYTSTNIFVRLLGYDVRPFPGNKINRFIQRLVRRVVKIGLRLGRMKSRRAEA